MLANEKGSRIGAEHDSTYAHARVALAAHDEQAREDERAPNAYIQVPNAGAVLVPYSCRTGAALAPRRRRYVLGAFGALPPRPPGATHQEFYARRAFGN